MNLRYLLDTTIVCSPVVKIPNSQIVKRLDEHGHESAIGAPVWHELLYGCARLPRGKRRSALESYFHDVVQVSFPILAYDEVAAAWHGQERARLEGVGEFAPYVRWADRSDCSRERPCARDREHQGLYPVQGSHGREPVQATRAQLSM